MKTIIILRHAKAEREAPHSNSDFDRPLADKGKEQLKTLPTLFQHCGCEPELILASPAARTKATAEAVHTLFPKSELVFDPTLYLAEAETIIGLLMQLPKSINSVCVVGHNPGLYELAIHVKKHDIAMPTLGMVRIDVQYRNWNDLKY